jgi:hypothetical protein
VEAWRKAEAGVKTKLIVFAIVLGIASLIVPVRLAAHHGNSSFDTGEKLTLKATVTEWFWANPHCFLKFDVTDQKGNVVRWVAETSNPSDMTNLGWSRQDFKPGDRITVTLQPVKNGQPIGRVIEVVLANGRTLGTRIPGVTDPGPDGQAK